MGVDFAIGPLATTSELQGKREIISYSSNKTASYVSNIFLGSGFDSPEKNLDGSIKLEKRYCELPVEKIPAIDLQRRDLCTVAEQIEQDIKNHIEVRLQLFLLQIMLLFESKIKVDKFRTQAQAGDKNKVPNISPLAPTEAHASTLPNLIAVTEEEYNNSYLTDEIDLTPRVFAKKTSYFEQANITHKLPSFVNDVDSDIDFRTVELDKFCLKFREQSVDLLNFVSTNSTMTPKSAFQNFMVRLHRKIEKISYDKQIHKQRVLNYYKQVVESYLRQNDDPNFIKRLMFDHDLDLPSIAKTLRQKIQYELLLLNKIGEIEAASHLCKEGVNCLLSLSTLNGRLDLLHNKVSDLSKTVEEYHVKGLTIPVIVQAAQTIINSDPTLAWVNLPLPSNFTNLVKTEILKTTGKKRIENVGAIGLKILWSVTMNHHAGNPKLATFLCFNTQKALQLMRESSTLGRNVRACLRDENIKRLLNEFGQILNS